DRHIFVLSNKPNNLSACSLKGKTKVILNAQISFFTYLSTINQTTVWIDIHFKEASASFKSVCFTYCAYVFKACACIESWRFFDFFKIKMGGDINTYFTHSCSYLGGRAKVKIF